MILLDFKAFPRVGRILGIDWGARRVGLAVSDETREFVFTRPVIQLGQGGTQDMVAQAIADTAEYERVVGIVIGLPVRSDGAFSDTTHAVQKFAEKLAMRTNLPICFIEENLTSLAAQEQMGRVRVRDIKERLDSESARVILENAIAVISRL